jgi:hypothetical protein
MRVASSVAKKPARESSASDGGGGQSPQRGRGRPPKADEEVKRPHLSIWLDSRQRRLIEEAATHDDDRPANWARRVLLREARKTLGFDSPPPLDADPTKPK